MSMNNISTETLRALSKSIESELKSRNDIPVGIHEIDSNVKFNVTGTVTKFEDETYVPTSKIAYKTAMALLVRYCGVTGQNALNALENAMKQSLNVDEKSADYITAIADLEAAEEKIQKTLEKLPREYRKGKTTVKCKCDAELI